MASDCIIKIDTSFDTTGLEIGMKSFESIVSDGVGIAMTSLESINTLFDGFDNSKKIFKFLDDNLGRIGERLPELTTSFTNLLTPIGTMATTAASSLAGLIGPLTTMAAAAVSSFASMIGPILAVAGPIAIVVAAIAGLALLFKHLWDTNEGFRNGVLVIWAGIKEGVGGAVETVVGIIDSFAQGLAAIPEIAANIVNSVVAFFSSLPGNIEAIIGSILAAIVQWAAVWENAQSPVCAALMPNRRAWKGGGLDVDLKAA